MRPAPTSPRFGYYLGVVFGGFPPALSFFGWLLPVLSDEELGLDGEDIESEEGGVELEVDGVSDLLGAGLDCMLLSELGGELSGAVPMAC